MPLKQLRTVEELSITALADKNYRSLKEVMRDIESIGIQVEEDMKLLKQFQRSLENSAKNAFIIESPTLNNSPKPKRAKVIKKVFKEVDKNFRVAQNLYEAKQSLELLEAKIKAASRDLGSDSSRALKGLATVRRQVLKGLDETFDFLSTEAGKSAPEDFKEFTVNLETLVSRAIAYQTSVSNTYVFTSEDSLNYAHYIHLEDLVDDNGAQVPSMYIVASAQVLEEETKYFLDVITEFEPPSAKLFVQPIDIYKVAPVALKLGDLLRVNQFANSIRRIPIKLLLQPSQIKPEMFLYQHSIQKVEVDEDEQQINFYLKSTIRDKADVDEIVKQLYVDTKGLLVATRARLRVAVTEKKLGKGRCFVIAFFLVRNENSPAAALDDLEFLKERFSLPDAALQEILKTINKN